jgi:hypothetical protein
MGEKHGEVWLCLRVVFGCVLALLALSASPEGGISNASISYTEDTDLCALLQQLAGTDPVHLSPGVGDPNAATQCVLDFTIQRPKFANMSIHKWDNPAEARSQVDTLVKGGVWVPTSSYGDQGHAYDLPDRPDPMIPQMMLAGALYYARDCYTVSGQAGYDFDTNKPLDPTAMRAMASAIDRELQKLPCTPLTPSPTPEGDVDLKVDHMEVVQVIQTYDNKVPLVANKKTMVRVFVRIVTDAPNRGPYNVGASLTIWPEGKSEVELQPTYQATDLKPNESADRNRTTASINFIVPPELTAPGVFSLKAVVNPDHSIKELDYSNNDDRQPFEFVQRNGLRVGFVRIGYMPPGHTAWDWPTDNIRTYDTLMKQIYPVAENGIQYYEMPWRIRVTRSLLQVAGEVDLVWSLREFYDSLSDKPDILVGWLPRTSEVGEGGLADIPVVGQEPRVAWIMDDGSKTGLAHEAGHVLGLGHPGTTGDPAPGCKLAKNSTPAYWPKEYGNSARVQEPGYDMDTLKIVPGNTLYDLMSYCSNNTSLSPFHYTKLFEANLRPSGQGDVNPKDKIKVRGLLMGDAAQIEMVDLSAPGSGGGGYISPAQTLIRSTDRRLRPAFAGSLTLPLTFAGMTPKSAPMQREGTGNYCLRFMDVGGTALYERCFDLETLSPETLEPIDQPGFVLTVPDPGKVANVVLVRNANGQEKELTSLKVSAHAPTLTITSPKVGDRWEGEHTITWTGSDEDGDKLRYDIQYSADGKQSWYPLEVGSHNTQYTFSTDEILPGEQTYIRILASDGYNTTASDVGPLVIPKQANSPALPPKSGSESGTQPPTQGTSSGGPDLAVIAIISGVGLAMLAGFAFVLMGLRRSRTPQAVGAVPYAPYAPTMSGPPPAPSIQPGSPPSPPGFPPRPRSQQPPMSPSPTHLPSTMNPAIQANFRWCEQEYQRLRGELAARRISPQQYHETLKRLAVRDAQGRSWMLAPDTGQWLIYDGRAWVPGRPY